MCGIFGFVGKIENKNFDFIDLINLQLNLSLNRGREGFGIFIKNKNKINILNLKEIVNEKRNIKDFNLQLKNLLNKIENLEYFGQTRLPTIGNVKLTINSVPIETKNFIGIHNGNIFFENIDYNNLEFSQKSDSRIFYEKLNKIYSDDPDKFDQSLFEILKNINGEANICFYIKERNIYYFFSNTGSFYFLKNKKFMLFLSEKFFINIVKKKFSFFRKFEIINLKKSVIKFQENQFIELNK